MDRPIIVLLFFLGVANSFFLDSQPSESDLAELIEEETGASPESQCLSSGCPLTAIGNGVCDNECNTPECNYDMGECADPGGDKPQDPALWAPIGSGDNAGSGGNVDDLGWTEKESTNSEQACLDAGCPSIALMGNSECDSGCNTEECNYDMGDCAQSLVATQVYNSLTSFVETPHSGSRNSESISLSRRLLDVGTSQQVYHKLKGTRRRIRIQDRLHKML